MGRTTSSKRGFYKQIAHDLHVEIGHASPGDLLDTEPVLAKRFKVNVHTVRRALGVLADQGLVRRHQGRGTVVVDRLTTGHIAVVLRPQLLGADASPFYAKTVAALTEQFHRRNPRIRLKLHLGREVPTGDLYPQTLDLLDPATLKDVRGVFTFHRLFGLGKKLQEMNVPIVGVHAFASSCDISEAGFDRDSILVQSVDRLVKASCKRIGLIWEFDHAARHPEPTVLDDARYRRFVELLTAAGMKVYPSLLQPHVGPASEQAGCDAMTRLWSLDEKPDGLVVMDDVLCRGVLRATLMLGIDPPCDLKLVTLASRDIGFPYHKSVTRVEFDTMQLAEHAVRQMTDLAGGYVSGMPIRDTIKGQLVEGETT